MKNEVDNISQYNFDQKSKTPFSERTEIFKEKFLKSGVI